MTSPNPFKSFLPVLKAKLKNLRRHGMRINLSLRGLKILASYAIQTSSLGAESGKEFEPKC